MLAILGSIALLVLLAILIAVMVSISMGSMGDVPSRSMYRASMIFASPLLLVVILAVFLAFGPGPPLNGTSLPRASYAMIQDNGAPIVISKTIPVQ